MIKDSAFKTLLPFLIVFCTAFFISGAELFESFGSRLNMLQGNTKLAGLLTFGFTVYGLSNIVPAYIFFRAWAKNSTKKHWFLPIFGQVAASYTFSFLLSLITLLGTFKLYLWITGIAWLWCGIANFRLSNTLWRAKDLLINYKEKEEVIENNKKLDEILQLLKEKQ